MIRLSLRTKGAGPAGAAGALLTASVLGSMALAPTGALAQVVAPHPPIPQPAALSTTPIPGPEHIADFIKNKAAAIRLGKALFWDQQIGSDGVVACATCHFHAGADSRMKNTMNPGFDGVFKSPGGPNFTLQLTDFPYHKLTDPNDRDSSVLSDRNDITGSQGVLKTIFTNVNRGFSLEYGNPQADGTFNVGGMNTRRVTGRNTPTNINAIFMFRNFWDGRAQNHFNGINPFGDRDPNARVLKVGVGGSVQLEQISLENCSPASQAVGPPGSPTEMSYDGRTFPKIGRKILSLMALTNQWVHPRDSAMGSIARSRTNPALKGLTKSYFQMVKDAIQPQWWDSNKIVTFDAGGHVDAISDPPSGPLSSSQYTVMEANFSLIWGLAIQMYEATLVSDKSPYDAYQSGKTTALTAKQKDGLNLFMGKGKCIFCHSTSVFTNTSVEYVTSERLERMIMGDEEEAVYDSGFYNIGVRKTAEDIGVGGTDPFGNPLSESRLAQIGHYEDGRPVEVIDPVVEPVLANERTAVNGNFKSCQLRNCELTGPYFHNGGQATLRQVVEFYNRGGDFSNENRHDLDADIGPIGLTDYEIDALVDFLKSLTDERVRWQRAPFDHPQFFVANGHVGDETACTPDSTGMQAKDDMIELPATGGTNGSQIFPTFPQ